MITIIQEMWNLKPEFSDNIRFVLKWKISLCRLNALRKCNYAGLKVEQLSSLKKLVNKQSLLVVLPTGYGKSLIFEILPHYFAIESNSVIPIVLIVEPLNVILKQQRDKFGDKSIIVTKEVLSSLSNDDEKVRSLREGHYWYVLGHPEELLSDGMWALYKSEAWSNPNRDVYIVVDEAHCIVLWGDGFREEYKEVGQLRSVLPRATMLALTGTCSRKMQDAITSSLFINGCDVVSSTVDRPNIFLSVCQRLPSTGRKHCAEDSLNEIMKPLLQELQSMREQFSKTILFCKKEWCGLGYEKAFIAKLADYTSMYHETVLTR